jgi:hypothetical protein
MPRHIAPLRALRFAGWSKTIQPTLPRFSTLSRFASGTVDRFFVVKLYAVIGGKHWHNAKPIWT